MARSINLEVITPSRRFYKGDVEMVIVRTLNGDEAFMAGHIWATKLLAVGELWVKEAGSTEFRVAAVSGGYVDVRDNVIIYTDAALWADDIDVDRSLSEKERAEYWLSTETAHNPEEMEAARSAIKKAEVRINVKSGGVRRKR